MDYIFKKVVEGHNHLYPEWTQYKKEERSLSALLCPHLLDRLYTQESCKWYIEEERQKKKRNYFKRQKITVSSPGQKEVEYILIMCQSNFKLIKLIFFINCQC